MPSFKPKTNKNIKVTKKNSTTLDGKHKEFINEFNIDDQDIIPKLEKERDELKQKMGKENLTIEQLLDYKDRILEIRIMIKELKQKKKEYYLNNSKHIFDYFEDKQNISKKETTSKNKILNTFFKIDTGEEQTANNVTKESSIFQKYLSNIDESFLDINMYIHPTDICQYCFKGELISMEDEGVLICNTCFRNIPYLIENEKPSYKEPPKEVCFYAYKKINHLNEWLAQFQAKETTEIPQDIFELIQVELKKERITDTIKLKPSKLRDILKKLKLSKYYEHVAHIMNRLNGVQAPVLSREVEDKLRCMFREIQPSFIKYCPKNRSNFLSYSYVLYKFCQLLELDEFLPCFPLLKSREKLYMQDKIWQCICEDMGWEFIKSI